MSGEIAGTRGSPLQWELRVVFGGVAYADPTLLDAKGGGAGGWAGPREGRLSGLISVGRGDRIIQQDRLGVFGCHRGSGRFVYRRRVRLNLSLVAGR